MGIRNNYMISMLKSSIRLGGCIGAMIFNDPMFCVYLFGFAEILGIIEKEYMNEKNDHQFYTK